MRYEARMSDEKTATRLPTIASAELARHVEANDVFLLDLRGSTNGTQIYGAIRYDPRKLLDAPRLALPLPKSDGLIVLYDEHGTSDELAEIGAKLRAAGFGEIRTLEGGFDAYEAADGKLEEATMEQPVPLVSEHQLER
jgi:rhodanese-related sulfurtransferase